MTLVLLAGLSAGVLQDAHGNVIPGRQVNVYARGTSTPVQVYADSAGSSPVTQPLTSDSSGQVPGYVAGGVSIDLVDALTGARAQGEPVFASSTAFVTFAPAPNGIDDTAAISALIQNSVTIQLQRGTYKFSGAIGINLDNVANCVLAGAAGSWSSGTVISYTGSGTAISLRGTGGNTAGSVIRNLSLFANTAAIVIDFGTSSVTNTASGSADCKLEKVSIASTSTTNILWNLSQAISCHADDCGFTGGGVQVQGVTVTGGFSNTHEINSCYFHTATTIPIKNPGQNWLLEGNTFEPLASGAAGAVLHDGTAQSNRAIAGSEVLTLIGNSFQDATGGTWCTLRGEGLCIAGNMFESGANHVVFPAAVIGVSITGNTFAGATTRAVDNSAAGAGSTSFLMFGNRFTGNAVNLSGAPGAGSMYSEPGLVGQSLFGFTFITSGPLDVNTVGHGLRVAEGSNAKQGVSSAMVAGTVTVANTAITASSRLLLTRQAGGTNPGAVYESTRTAGTSFVITSTNASDTGTVAYQIFEPG